ncbi:MAG: hypothetical protein IT236_14655 [Bacteroidia bacterium]|nr:hypothetical protein [Bacteroidia bacterium]
MALRFILSRNRLTTIPTAGIVVFVLLYIAASSLYPGGSQHDLNSVGFSWLHNYWCNLLDERAMNGAVNTARPLALAAMLVLCLSVSWFWILFPRAFKLRGALAWCIQISGLLSMVIALFLFTAWHDAVTFIASFFGIIACLGTYFVLYKQRLWPLFWLGIFNLILIGANNYLYFNQRLLVYLPIVQKITFAFFLIWVAGINIKMKRD